MKINNKNRISVITATYNNEKSIERCLASINNQTFKAFEHIIIDGASSDKTLNYLKKNQSKTSILLSEPDSGVYFALNKGLKLASGDIIAFLHGDDYYASNHVLEEISNIMIHEDVDIVYGDLCYVSKNTKNIVRFWKSGKFRKWKFFFGWMPPHPTLFVRREIYRKINYFNTSFKISSDYDSILKMFILNDFKSFYIPRVLVFMETGGISNKSLKNIFLKSSEDYSILAQYNNFPFTILILKNLLKLKQFFNFKIYNFFSCKNIGEIF